MKHSYRWSVMLVAAMLYLQAAVALAEEQVPTGQSPIIFGGAAAKAAVDTVTLMGPYGDYPYRGDFETANAMPGGDGLLTDGWTSRDFTVPGNHWRVDSHNNPGSGLGAWCGDPALASCDVSDPVGGYGNNWRDVLELRKTVPGAATVRVQGRLRYDTEPGYDFVTLQRRTAAHPDFESISGGQGLSWDGQGTVTVDFTFAYTAAELVDGADIAVAFIVDSDGGWSDADCLWPTDGAATVDDLVVTVTAGGVIAYAEDFEDGTIGPDWRAVPNIGVGDFARVWSGLCENDPCGGNHSKQVAFIDFYPGLWIVPPPPAGCGRVNSSGGLLGAGYSIDNRALSPVMPLPGGDVDGVTLAFDVYQAMRQGYIDDPAILWQWGVRSTAGGVIEDAPWVSRNFVYYGGPEYRRIERPVGDLLVPGATAVQVFLGVWQGAYWPGSYYEGTVAPYFDNVRVLAYPSAGPRIVADERYLSNDGFPASGSLALGDLAANSVRFDMAANIAARSHMRNDPGDSLVITVTPRRGAAIDPPLMHWTLARRNPLFDPYRTLPSGPITGRVTRSAAGAVLANRWNFDLPDSGFLFPGDVLHYYFSATDHRGGDARTATMPVELAGYGDADTGAWPDNFRVRCLPSLRAGGEQPPVLVWNDQDFRGAEDEWTNALRAIGLVAGQDYDMFTTRAPTSGLGNGLGGRATVAQVAGYTDLFYTSGDLGSPTLSPGDFNGDPGNDLGLVNGWLALGGRDLLLCGDDLASSLYASGTVGRAFLETTMGLVYDDADVRDDIGGQASPTVVKVPGNPVFTAAASWLLYGGCPVPNDFDAVLPQPGAVTLARFTDAGGVVTPYAHPAAVLKATGTNRVISLPYDLSFVMSWGGGVSGIAARALLLSNVVDYFGVPYNPGTMTGVPAASPLPLAVSAQPNPFNPVVELRYALPRPGHLAMKVFDARGALVRTLADGPVATASGVIIWDGADDRGGQAASGLYFVETRADGQVDVRKVTLLK